MDFIKNHKGLVAVVAIVAVLVIIVSGFFGYVNTTRNSGIQKEAGLVAQYQDNQNELSTYLLQFNETLGIADKQSEVLNNILLDAVKGRYDNDTSLEPGTGGSMFSAISEAYPDLTTTTETYAKVQDLVISGRNAYKNKQSKLLDLIRDYNTWRETDIIRSFVVKNILGFPSDNLKVTVGENIFRGQDALDKISQLVLTQGAIDSYNSGTMEPLIEPKGNEE
jgi:hypothetical protein